ncbi:Gfo/Idh/MocA family oxidoreductase [Fusobacterium perfoetens]|uniref:Gfo/Idh/MocA family protein n=1 Tax=Fusobacterium perfoetens TaxID=852 RepID=UPI001F3EB4BD|nr:Gfo/Idh/MocA family oxidoreductase [Fusobacterium perfoetens]MCF2624821.1 Gfo/Idh/MocA family oxidoreductase [Fusobacterium perfoetens]
MVRFGIIGTNWISGDFIEAIKITEGAEVKAVYSRKRETAEEFVKKYNIENCRIFTDLEKMAESEEIDAVYVGSPNSLHSSQSILCLKNKKHVICEKPIATKVEDFDKMTAIAEENNVTLMEAMKTTFLPNIQAVRENIGRIGDIRNITANFCQYSSRYDLLKKGEVTNVFNPEFDGGSAFDIGVYPLYFVLSLFGIPKSYTGSNIFLSSGVDGAGNIILNYGDKIASVIYSKITETNIPSEILGEKGSIVINHISTADKVEIIPRNGEKEDISCVQEKNQMIYELKEFISLIKKGEIESKINSFELSRKSVEILSYVRKI